MASTSLRHLVPVLNDQAAPLKDRSLLALSLVLSRLLFNTGGTIPREAQTQPMQHVLHRVYEALDGSFSCEPCKRKSFVTLAQQMGLPRLHHLLMLQRLRLFARQLEVSMDAFFAIAQASHDDDQSWFAQLRADLFEIRANTESLIGMPDPHEDLQVWADYIQSNRPQWNRVITRHCFKYHHQDDIPTILVSEPSHECVECHKQFCTPAALACHRRVVHGTVSCEKLWAGSLGSACPVCLWDFNVSERLIRHFRAVPRCLHAVATFFGQPSGQ